MLLSIKTILIIIIYNILGIFDLGMLGQLLIVYELFSEVFDSPIFLKFKTFNLFVNKNILYVLKNKIANY